MKILNSNESLQNLLESTYTEDRLMFPIFTGTNLPFLLTYTNIAYRYNMTATRLLKMMELYSGINNSTKILLFLQNDFRL